MKIVVTGAAGSVGTQLIPLLKSHGAELLLVGRDAAKLKAAFPQVTSCTYDEMVQQASGFDALVHLAVLNNNIEAPVEDFYAVNVTQMLDTAAKAERAGIGNFILLSSTHALDQDNLGPYATSKRAAVQALVNLTNLRTSVVYLPAVYGDRWSGQLSRLNALPKSLASVLFKVLAALKATVHVSRLADFVLSGEKAPAADETILSDGQLHNPFYRGVRRLIDLSFALAIVVFLWWLLVAIWLIIKVQSTGPGIFAQQRVGRDGKIFTCYKFRTMKVGTAQLGTHQVGASAVTGIGGFLRRTKIDELPQVLNILKNEISLVGPRPCLPVQNSLVEARRRRGVLRLKPGISGLSQVRGIDMSNPELLAKWDARYAAIQSLTLDLNIIVRTATGGGQGDRVA